jgi:hypothetical protein
MGSVQDKAPVAPAPVQLRRVLVIVAVLGIVAIAWFAFALISPIDLPFQRVEAAIHPRVTVEGATAHVTGTTTLPDGAVINYYYSHELDAVNDRNEPHAGTATVHDGRFVFSADLSDWPAGTVTLYTEFSVAWGVEQPADVVARFGSEGEHMAGPQVYVDSPGDPKMLLVPVEFDLPSAAPAS